jgi:DUF971 family protein
LTAIERWPEELRVKDRGRSLHIRFNSDEVFELPAELLRVESPSAEVKGHGPGQEQLVFGKRHVAITRAEPVGTYAIRLIFSDGHDTGLFTWTYLAELGLNQQQLWQNYETKLASAKRSRG